MKILLVICYLSILSIPIKCFHKTFDEGDIDLKKQKYKHFDNTGLSETRIIYSKKEEQDLYLKESIEKNKPIPFNKRPLNKRLIKFDQREPDALKKISYIHAFREDYLKNNESEISIEEFNKKNAHLIDVFGLEGSDKFDICMSFPKNSEDFGRIFGRAPTSSELAEINPLLGQVRKIDRQSFTNPSGVNGDYRLINSIQGREEFSKKVNNSSNRILTMSGGRIEKYLVVIGHNDQGKFLFPDGTSIELAEIENLETDYKRVIFLSCFAKRFVKNGPDFELSYNEALHITLEMITNTYEAGKLIDKDLDKIFDSMKSKLSIKILKKNSVKAGAGGTIIIVTYEILD